MRAEGAESMDPLPQLAPLSMAPHWVSAGVLVLIAIGLLFRHRREIHIPLMLSSLAVDLGNVVTIELRRAAVEKAARAMASQGEWLIKFHVAVSLVALIGYGVALITGLRIWKGKGGRRVHRLNMAVFLAARVLNFLTGFCV